MSELAMEVIDEKTLIGIDGGEKPKSYVIQLATECVNRADNVDSKNPDVRTSIGICYARLGMLREARQAFARALELWNEARMRNSEPELLLAIAKLNEAFSIQPLHPVNALLMGERSLFAKDYEKAELFYRLCLEGSTSRQLIGEAHALKAKLLHLQIELAGYLNAIKLYENDAKTIPPEVLNNLGILHFLDDGNIERARSFLQRGLEITSDKDGCALSIHYNLARLAEEAGDYEIAESTYRDISLNHPAYTDCTLRLASLMISQGKIEEARNSIKKLIAVDQSHVVAHLLLGYSYYEDKSQKANLREARRTFEEVLQTMNKNEPYALCAVGNINLVFAKLDPKNRELHNRRAFEFYDKALRLDPKNLYAAAGIGIGLAEVNRLGQARDVLTQREKLQEEEQRKAEVEQKRREIMERTKLENEKMRELESIEEQRRSAKRGRDDDASDNEAPPAPAEIGEGKRKRASKSTKPKSTKRKRVVGSSDEDSGNDSKKIAGKQSTLSKEFVESDDDEMET
ncbi:protein required for normal CLN1 and CLN2 G1 cyclin expression [Phlyctochytrium bullatum]|nr:protein required for normal CLN1 and CLN2 G1 cyclin expression [Phlyctochytrium bullatum]